MNSRIRHIFLDDDDDDDDDEDRQFFKEALAKLSDFIDIVTFDHGISLIDQLLKTHEKLPDAIFLDLNMPLMNGEECLADIRNESKSAQVPVIIYSTSLDRAKVEYLYEKRCEPLFTKTLIVRPFKIRTPKMFGLSR